MVVPAWSHLTEETMLDRSQADATLEMILTRSCRPLRGGSSVGNAATIVVPNHHGMEPECQHPIPDDGDIITRLPLTRATVLSFSGCLGCVN